MAEELITPSGATSYIYTCAYLQVVVATNCPWDNGASIIALQQPSPSQAVLQAGPDADTLITPSMSVRMCGDGIPIWQREECDMGVDGA